LQIEKKTVQTLHNNRPAYRLTLKVRVKKRVVVQRVSTTTGGDGEPDDDGTG